MCSAAGSLPAGEVRARIAEALLAEKHRRAGAAGWDPRPALHIEQLVVRRQGTQPVQDLQQSLRRAEKEVDGLRQMLIEQSAAEGQLRELCLHAQSQEQEVEQLRRERHAADQRAEQLASQTAELRTELAALQQRCEEAAQLRSPDRPSTPQAKKSPVFGGFHRLEGTETRAEQLDEPESPRTPSVPLQQLEVVEEQKRALQLEADQLLGELQREKGCRAELAGEVRQLQELLDEARRAAESAEALRAGAELLRQAAEDKLLKASCNASPPLEASQSSCAASVQLAESNVLQPQTGTLLPESICSAPVQASLITAEQSDASVDERLSRTPARRQGKGTLSNRSSREAVMRSSVKDEYALRQSEVAEERQRALVARKEELDARMRECAAKEEELLARESELSHRVEEAAKGASQAATRVEELEARERKLAAGEEEAAAKMRELCEREAQLEARLRKVDEVAEETGAKMREVRAKEAQLEDELRELAFREEELTEATRELKAKEDEVSAHLHELSAEKDELASKLHELSAKKDELANKMHELSLKEEGLEAKTLDLRGREGEIRERVSEVEAKEKELSLAQQRLTAREEELTAKKGHLADEEKKLLREAEEELLQLRGRAESAEQERLVAGAELDRLRAMNALLQADLSSAAEARQTLEKSATAAFSSARPAVDPSTPSIEDLRAQLCLAEQQVQMLTEENRSLKTTLASTEGLSDRLRRAETARAALASDNIALKEVVDFLEEEGNTRREEEAEAADWAQERQQLLESMEQLRASTRAEDLAVMRSHLDGLPLARPEPAVEADEEIVGLRDSIERLRREKEQVGEREARLESVLQPPLDQLQNESLSLTELGNRSMSEAGNSTRNRRRKLSELGEVARSQTLPLAVLGFSHPELQALDALCESPSLRQSRPGSTTRL